MTVTKEDIEKEEQQQVKEDQSHSGLDHEFLVSTDTEVNKENVP